MYASKLSHPGERESFDYNACTSNPEDRDLDITCQCGGQATQVDLEVSLGASVIARACPGWIMDGDGDKVKRRKRAK